MPETQEATVGYMGEFHLGTDATEGTLAELHEVKSFKIPQPGAREKVETTHLKTPNWRRTYVETFYEDSTFDVVVNSRLRSDTDVLLRAAEAAGDERSFLAVIPEDGAPVTDIAGTCICTNYDPGEVSLDGIIMATATFRVLSLSAPAAHA